MAEKKPTETPMMKQFFAFKAEYPEAVLLFRCGDFYETYGEQISLGQYLLHHITPPLSFWALSSSLVKRLMMPISNNMISDKAAP